MKAFCVSLIVVLFAALVSPCAHVVGHAHSAGAAVLCSQPSAACHCCSDEPCSKPEDLLLTELGFSLEIPERWIQRIRMVDTVRPVCIVVPRPHGELFQLQTIQLLI